MGRPDTLQLAEWPEQAPATAPHEYPHVVHVLHFLGDGALAFVLRVVAELDDLGFRQTLVVARDGESTPLADGLRRVDCIEVPALPGRLEHARRVARILRALAGESGPLTVHLHAAGPGLLQRLLLATMHRRAVRLFTPHGMPLLNPRRPIARALNWTLERLASLLPIAPVGRGVGEARMLARAWRRPAFVLENPVDDLFFAIEPRPVQPPIIVCVGRPAEHNAPETFAQLALRFEIDELPVQFVWVGDGDPAHEARLRASGVHVTGRIAPGQIAAILGSATVFLQTSMWEGMPAALVSAMAAGLPCVVADVPSHRDIVVHGKTGFIVRDLDDFDRHLRWLLGEPELRRRLGDAARRECRQRFARDRFRVALRHLYGPSRAQRDALRSAA